MGNCAGIRDPASSHDIPDGTKRDIAGFYLVGVSWAAAASAASHMASRKYRTTSRGVPSRVCGDYGLDYCNDGDELL